MKALWLAGISAAMIAVPCHAGTVVALNEDFTQLSLEELLNVQVTSVSKRAEPLRSAAAAIFVLSGDDIRRSGARTIPDALRLVPGLQVYRNGTPNNGQYIVTARGLGFEKLEVLLDGRVLYQPLDSLVFWDVADTYLNDIDRIEVIRGPGAALWGANAVNGVINIVTKSAKDTQGTELEAGGGLEQRNFGGFRKGAKVGDSGYARFYAKAFERDASIRPNGTESIDGQRQGQAGFRSDWSFGPQQDLTVSGDYYDGREAATRLSAVLAPTAVRVDDANVNGANMLSRWTYRSSERSELSVQGYYDHVHRLMPTTFEDQVDTGDLQFQHRYTLSPAQTFIYGAGYRVARERDAGAPNLVRLNPASMTLETLNAFVQDQIRLSENGELTLGSKVEHYTFTRFALQPSIRLGWMLGEHAFTWGSVSRALRLPSRFDEALTLCVTPTLCFPLGNSEFKPEKVIAYEWGLRAWTAHDLAFDLTTFVNRYTDHRSIEATAPLFANGLQGYTYGGEFSVSWAVRPWLTLRPTYAFLKIDFQPAPGSTDTRTSAQREGDAPQQSAGLRLDADLGHNVSLDSFLRFVDSVPIRHTPGYTELNLRLAWKALPTLDFAIVGSDLLDHAHPETSPGENQVPVIEVERAIWADVTWSWK